MNFEETEEQAMIREMVRDFAEEVLSPTVNVRDANQSPPREEWKKFIDSGLHSVTIPEEFGGNPVDHISESNLPIKRTLSGEIEFKKNVGPILDPIPIEDLLKNQFQKEKYLPQLATDKVGAYSLSEAGSGTDAASMSCSAKLNEEGTHYILNGEKMWVTNGSQADIIVLFAKDVDHPDFGN